MKEKILAAMRKEFGRDQRRIDHAVRVLELAERLLAEEGKADPEIVTAAAILHDIGIQAAEKKYGSNAGRFQEIEGPPIAEAILKELGFPESKTAEVLAIIAHHHSPGKISGVNFVAVYDADQIVNLAELERKIDRQKLDRILLSVSGRKLAQTVLFPGEKI